MNKQNTLKQLPAKSDCNSKFLVEFMRNKAKGGKDFSFDQIEHIRCEKHFELKDYFMLSKTKEIDLYEIICSTCLSDLNIEYDDNLKSKLYSRIILDQKEKIVQIKHDQINFELFTTTKSMQVHTHNDIMCIADELLNFNDSFENEVIDKMTTCKTSNEEIEKIKDFIMKILNKDNEPILKNIGQNEDLKIRYIHLAYFLLKFKVLKKEEMDYNDLTKNLKKHILDIVQIRKRMNINIERWLRLVLGEFYSFSHELENIPYDQEFYRSIPIEYIEKNSLIEIETLKEVIRSMARENNQLKDVN